MKYTYSPDDFGVHQRIIQLVPHKSLVLDVGCASGYIAHKLYEKNCRVVGVDTNKEALKIADRSCQKTILGDIEQKKVQQILKRQKFDVIVLADVLEHLRQPEKTLLVLKHHLNDNGFFVISVPNISFLTQRLLHLIGRFEYTDTGIMDRTHLYFYTWRTLQVLLKSSNLDICRYDYVGNFTQLPLFMQIFYPLVGSKLWFRKLEHKITGLWIEGLAIQFIVVCKIK